MADNNKPEDKKPSTTNDNSIQNVASSKGPRLAIRPTTHVQASDIDLPDILQAVSPDPLDVIRGKLNFDDLP